MANPRKFSEKIALHTQKQAEETAAFEAIMQEVNSATRDPPRYQKQHITPNLGTYRGGSLPNVNQMSHNQSIDLQATLQHLDDMKQGRSNPVDRGHVRIDRHRQQIGPHRRNFPPDKRIDSSPYGSAYHLSPPPDTSWRRVHSDPSLHMNAMGNAANSHHQVAPASHRRIVEMVGENADGLQLNYWESKKMGQSRPKSCEVPNINIYPSQEQETTNTTPPIPMTANNTGSLPDLSVLQFPPPLATPLDNEDPYSSAVNSGSSPSNLSPTSPCHIPMSHQSPQSPNQRRRQAQGVSIPSPLVLSQMAGPHSAAGMADMGPCMRQQYMCLQQQQQQQQLHQQHQQQHMRHRGSNSPLSQPYPLPVSPLYSSSHSNRSPNQRQTTKPSIHNHHLHHISPTGSPTHSHLTGTQSQLMQQSQQFTPSQQSQQQTSHHNQQNPLTNSSPQHPPKQQQQQSQGSPLSPPVPHVHITNCDDPSTQGSMSQYRNSGVSDTNCQSPTSPHSAPSYSPAQSPGLTPTNQDVNSTFSDAYFIQQQQQQQTSALQHQFEQFNMNPPQVNSTTLGSVVMTTNGLGVVSSSSNNTVNSMAFSQQPGVALQFSQAAMLGLTSSDDLFQPHFLGPIDVMASGQTNNQPSLSSPHLGRHNTQHNSLSSSPSNSKIPDIVLTGADDLCRLPLDFAKDLGNAITGITDGFDAEFLANDEAFKAGLDPLDMEEIQMLADASLVADPATEDTFKLDRL